MARATRRSKNSLPPQIVLNGAPGWSPSRHSGFDFTVHIRAVCQDMIERLPELQHIDLCRVAIGFCQTRKAVGHGMQAALTPLRFENGDLTGLRYGTRYSVQQVVDDHGNEFLYLLTFYLPRFLNQPFSEKLVTILHELWHISPQFNGDLRRHKGRCYVHTRSEEEYDAAMAVLADRWLGFDPPATLYNFLNQTFESLSDQHGNVFGMRIPAPKLIPCD